MSGFPVRSSRSDFGPKPVNTRPVRDPERDLDASIGHLLFHQVAGASAAGARAWLATDIVAGPDVAIAARGESWNPDDIQTSPYTPPIVARSGVGVYTVDYQAEYPDENGDLQPLVIGARFADAIPVAPPLNTLHQAWHAINLAPPAGLIRITVQTLSWVVGSSTDWALVDAPFFVAIW